MRKIAVLVLLFLSLAVTTVQSVNAASETFQLVPETYIVKVFELQQGEYFDGSFNISTLYSYKSLFDNRNYTYWVAVDVQDRENNIIANYSTLDDNQLYQFSFTANSSGRYEIRFFCGHNFFPPEAIVPQVTFNYYVTSSAQPTSVQPSTSSVKDAYSTAGYFLLAALTTVILVGALLFLYIKRRGLGRKIRLIEGG
jgi:hypothetical protein